MDRYKFRGKRLDNGEWVEGFGVEVYETVGNATKAFLYTNQDEYMVVKTYEVDPATVGQYTGLKDKNGKEIYEGDILDDGNGNKYFIHYFQADCRYISVMVYAHGLIDDYDECTYENEGFGEEVWVNHEVIGNIHDNPELLEG